MLQVTIFGNKMKNEKILHLTHKVKQDLTLWKKKQWQEQYPLNLQHQQSDIIRKGATPNYVLKHLKDLHT